jgi:uncharacterized membrane protein YbaN (DUF454 family)
LTPNWTYQKEFLSLKTNPPSYNLIKHFQGHFLPLGQTHPNFLIVFLILSESDDVLVTVHLHNSIEKNNRIHYHRLKAATIQALKCFLSIIINEIKANSHKCKELCFRFSWTVKMIKLLYENNI